MSAVNVADNNVSSSNILCLDIDCLEELFEWLSLCDLWALRASCKRMKLAVDYYIQNTYPNPFGNFQISDSHVNSLQNCNISNFLKWFKHIEFTSRWKLTELDAIKNVLKRIEKITVVYPWYREDFYDRLLLCCENLKSLHINMTLKTGLAIEWIQHAHLQIEHFGLTIDSYTISCRIPELQQFFELNPNIKRFSTDTHILCGNADWITESNAKLDQLDITEIFEFIGDDLMSEVSNILNTIHKRGFYKRLHLYMDSRCDEDVLNKVATLPGLEKLYIDEVVAGILWPSLMQLNEFSMNRGQDVANIEMLVDKCANIERVFFRSASFDEILPFIHRSTKMKQLKINSPINDTYFNGNVIDLLALNEERVKCSNGSKITIYVEEDVFLETKRALMQTDFELIELKRAESYEWELNFYSMFYSY